MILAESESQKVEKIFTTCVGVFVLLFLFPQVVVGLIALSHFAMTAPVAEAEKQSAVAATDLSAAPSERCK